MTAVMGRDIHVGDVIHRNDWHLHVTQVDIDAVSGRVAYAVTEFEFLLHAAGDELVDLDPPAVTP